MRPGALTVEAPSSACQTASRTDLLNAELPMNWCEALRATPGPDGGQALPNRFSSFAQPWTTMICCDV